ncbi:MAG: hypothetical protein R3F17_13015 [Planctomycetota bacterium]
MRRALGLIGLIACLLPSCRSYTEKTGRALTLFESGRFAEAEHLYADKGMTGSTFLSGAEAGLSALSGGDFPRAIEHLTSAAQFAEDVEMQALLDPSALAQSLTSMVVSETAKDYKGEGFERVMVHSCLGLAYLATGSIEDLLVEVRRANDLLVAEEGLYETEYKAGGFAHFLSAVGYELRGEPDQAFVDYYAMLEKGVGEAIAGPSAGRLVRQMHRESSYPELMDRFGAAEDVPANSAQVILIAGVGRGPIKVEGRLDVPTSDGVFSWAVPSFQARGSSTSHLELSAGGVTASSVIVEDVTAVATKNLGDRLAYLSLKSAVRGLLKRQFANQMRKDHGEGAFVLAQIFTMATERADLRSWTTLPDTWQAARVFPQPGEVDLTLRAVGGETVSLGSYEMEPGETIFLLARTLGPQVYVHVLGGKSLTEAAPVPNSQSTP